MLVIASDFRTSSVGGKKPMALECNVVIFRFVGCLGLSQAMHRCCKLVTYYEEFSRSHGD